MTPVHVNIRPLREGKGLSQQALSNLTGIRQPTISALEAGKARRVSLDALERLADALGVEPRDLIVRETKRRAR
jgi:transcriptional regulator with XRE-family HTH domain